MQTPIDSMIIRQMKREELDTLVEWAAEEGWNPGLDDAEVFWQTDPEGFIAAELDGQLIGGGSIVSYGGHYGFMGFFIIRKNMRGHGLGNRLWHERKKRLLARLNDGAAIGMDGVFDMQAYYTKGGFVFDARDMRFEGIGQEGSIADHIVPIEQVPFQQLDQYDQAHFPAPRTNFLRQWIQRPGGHAYAAIKDGQIQGYTVMRPCRSGYKVGPLFADNPEIAEDLFHTVASQVPGQALFLDVPENNPAAVQLAQRHDMKEVFGCAKMYLGPKPELPMGEIFGVTTFELG